MILYKYTAATFGLGVLRTKEIRFSQLNSLNDPFESHLPVTDLITDDNILYMLDIILSNQDMVNQVIGQTVDSMYTQFAEHAPPGVSKEAFEDYLAQKVKAELAHQGRTLHDFLQEELNKKKPQIIQDLRHKLPESLAAEIGSLSLTAIADNEVMWSHYADAHRGMLLGFDSGHPFLENAFRVKYQNERPRLDVVKLSAEDVGIKDRVQAFFGIKNEAWAYEQEYRLIEAVKTLRDSGAKDSRGIQVFVKQFPPAALLLVTFGSRLSMDIEKQVRAELQRTEYAHVKLCREFVDKATLRIAILDA